MAVTRRSFLRRLGGAAALPLVASRGLEAWAAAPAPPGAPPDGRIRLDSNENPHGPSPAALDALRAAFDEACRYPGAGSTELVSRLAAAHRVGPESVALGCGSTELLQTAVDAFASPGRALLTASPSYERPVGHARAKGIPVTAVPVTSALELDLDGMLERSVGAGLVYVCNPNNPTGTSHDRRTLERFVERVLARAPAAHVMVDEAYVEYVDRRGHGTLVDVAREEPRVFVLRTFSKVFGMAGLRLGYAIGRPETIAAMAPHRLRFGVNVLATAAALAMLDDRRHVERERRRNAETRNFTRRFFERSGFEVAPSETNFLMVHIRRPIEGFRKACDAAGVAVGRPFPPLDRHARITIGTADEMRRAVEVFGRVLAG